MTKHKKRAMSPPLPELKDIEGVLHFQFANGGKWRPIREYDWSDFAIEFEAIDVTGSGL